MKFAFLVHPINSEMEALWALVGSDAVRCTWGVDLSSASGQLHEVVERMHTSGSGSVPSRPRVVDELTNLRSPTGATATGRLYEIPMMPDAILEDPQRALDQMQQAVTMATDWGASIVGLGSMTGIIGGRGTFLAEHRSVAITTGNSLTVYAALQNVYRAAEELDIDLRRQTVAIVGVPGSIASAIARLISPQCGELLLVGRRVSRPALKLADDLDSEFLLDIQQALSRSHLVISATSSGHCIDEPWLLPGTVVVDVGVPSDVESASTPRDDVLILTGGFVRVPPSMGEDSAFLWFQHGMIPSCLGETIALALAGRAESFSLGRSLNLDAVQEIGSVAREHGFDFSQLYSGGRLLEDSRLIQVQKWHARHRSERQSRAAMSPDKLAQTADTLYARHINPVLGALSRSSGLIKTFVRGEGVWLFDRDGNRYLDAVAGFGSMNLGHNHPRVVEAVTQALAKQSPGFAQSAVNSYAAALAKELAVCSPDRLEMVTFTNSGTEAIEASLKLARKATGRTGLLSCEGGFHGKTMGALSLAGNGHHRRPFEPLVPGCEQVPYGDFEALDRALVSRRFAAFIVEPIQSEGGVNVAPAGYLREAQALCHATGTLLIVDEIQTGLGRTGTLFAVEHEDVRPDILTLAKSLGGGLMPIGAMLARRDIWMQAYGTLQTFALQSSTFAGGSLACAAGMATLHTLTDDELTQNARERGRELQQALETLCEECHCVRAVRGRGLLLGLEFQPLASHIQAHWKNIDRTGMTAIMIPDHDRFLESFHVVHAMQTLLNGHGIYTQTARSNPLVLRIEPPLVISADQAGQLSSSLRETCHEIDYTTRLIDAMISKSSVGEIQPTSSAADRVPNELHSPR